MATYHPLFFEDNSKFFAMERLRAVATEVVNMSSLIKRCAAGDRRAAEALFLGFWEFVYRFEKAIDARLLPREPLNKRFESPRAQSQLRTTAKTIRLLQKEELKGILQSAKNAVQQMQIEEAQHSAHWAKDAENLELSKHQLEQATIVPSVQTLVDGAHAEDIVQFFAVLAGTELIAEELSIRLVHAPPFGALFRRQRAIWMLVHTIPHDGSPSHLEIDMDLARAYATRNVDPAEIEDMILETIHLFGRAADEVEAVFTRQLAVVE